MVFPLVPLKLCIGEAGLLVTPKYGYFRHLLPLVSVVGHNIYMYTQNNRVW